MAEHKEPQNDILTVQRFHSNYGAHYNQLSPIQITVEYCTNPGNDGIYAVELTSTDNHFYRAAPIGEDFNHYNNRPPHKHSFFEIMFVTEGEIIQEIEKQEYLYPAGSCCLINRNVHHTERFRKSARLLFVGISVELIQQIFRALENSWFPMEKQLLQNPILTFLAEDLHNSEAKAYLDIFPVAQNVTHAATLECLLSDLQNQLLNPQPGSTFLSCTLLIRLFAYIGNPSAFHSSRVELGRNTEDLIFLHITQLLEDTNGRMSRSELEKALNYSGNYLNSIVVRHTGLCLFDYGMTFCMEKARKLLIATRQTVQDIALELGFSNRTHFYKTFAAQTGMTPGQFRKHSRDIASAAPNYNDC